MTGVEDIKKEKLRTGYTTGTSATAAAQAALLSVVTQTKIENTHADMAR